MPIFRKRTAFEIARGVTAFFNLEAGVVRGKAPVSVATRSWEEEPRDGWMPRRPQTGSVNPENIVWIFGTGRTGSTWLMDMMGDMPQTAAWSEPKIASLFGDFYDRAQSKQRNSRKFVLGDPLRKGWIPLIRDFALGSINLRYAHFGPNNHLVIKEPNARAGTLFVAEAMPESCLILLVRDPRDVVASFLDARKKGSWAYQRRDIAKRGRESRADTDPDGTVRERTRRLLDEVTEAKRAYDAHGGPKALVRYEDLRSDTLGTMWQLYSSLRLPFKEKNLARAVKKHSWENIPEEDKGEGKKFRKATPGGWSEDLTPKQARLVERIAAPLLKKFYPETMNEK